MGKGGRPQFDAKLISVIMPCFNGELFIRDSVVSVLKQTYQNLELIIVDDGSTDSSPALLEQMREADGRVRVFHQTNKGPGPARNKGLSEARGEYIAFLDADDYWAPQCLEKLEKALSSMHGTELGLAYCGWQNTGSTKRGSQPFIPPDYSQVDLPELFLGGCRWPIHAVLFKRQCADKVGGFDEQWSTCMDYDLWLRMTPFIRVTRVSEVLAFYRHHDGDQITKKRALLAVNHWKIQKKFIAEQREVRQRLGRCRVRQLVYGEMLKRGYICYWDRDLDAAHTIFRQVMKSGYGRIGDMKYMLFALFPLPVYKKIIQLLSRGDA